MTTRIRIAAAIAMLAAGAAIVAGALTPTGDATSLYGEVYLVPGYEPGPEASCLFTEGRATPGVMGTFIPGWDGGTSYALVAVCTSPASEDAGYPELTTGMDPLPPAGSYRIEAYDGGPQVRVWALGHPEAPWACACAPAGGTCEWQREAGGTWEAAPRGLTLAPGTFRGDCVRKPCGSFAEADAQMHPVDRTMPEACQP